MSGSIAIPFSVGSKVWWARVNRDAEWVTCPSCAGTLRHTVTLGNGEAHVVWCEDCGASRKYDYDYDLSQHENNPGFVRRYSVRAEVEEVTLAQVEIRGEEINYYGEARGNSRYIYRCEGLFATESEARAYCETVLVPAAAKEEEDRFARSMSRGKYDMEKIGRNAAWWAKQRKEAAETLARIDRRLERIKTEKRAEAKS